MVLALVAGCGLVDRIAGRRGYVAEDEAMEPTIEKGGHVTSRLTDGEYVPRRGDVIVFRAPETWRERGEGGDTLSRVVGVPGSVVECCDSMERMVVNGESLEEPYLLGAPASRTVVEPFTVPDGHVWVLGDNRDSAIDSRSYRTSLGGGAVPVANVISVVEIEGSR
ncbi:signal peptidase I [Streptosporangium sp. NPDC002721]|uniref:signal peptidase I n=1 Tax=Streptosporangium sp. NPDC002721 TaxID=3366188 RepID=UPI0036791BD5